MSLQFTDAHDNKGVITDDFSVEYDGPEDVETYVNDIVNTASTEEQAVQDIIIDLPVDLNIKGVRKI